MTSPTDVARFHAEYDHHTDDRIRLFGALSDLVPSGAKVVYPGSYVDIAPSVWFDHVTYVDTDRRTPRFFAQKNEIDALIAAKRRAANVTALISSSWNFHHGDYRAKLPIDDASCDLLISLYAGFISEHCARYLRPGGLLVVNSSHGDAAMAALDPRMTLIGVLTTSRGGYRLRRDGLEAFLTPKRGSAPTAEELHRTGRGIAYVKPAAGHIFMLGRSAADASS